MKLWEGMTDGVTDPCAESFNSSVSFDKRLYKQDITGSIVHAQMLCKCGIINEDDAELITHGLSGIMTDIETGALIPDPSCEDIHTFIEQTLTSRIGEAGKRLHTARSRNDQVAQDLRLWCVDEIDRICGLLKDLIYKTAYPSSV